MGTCMPLHLEHRIGKDEEDVLLHILRAPSPGASHHDVFCQGQRAGHTGFLILFSTAQKGTCRGNKRQPGL